MLALAEHRDGPDAAHATAAWRKHRPDGFNAVRERDGDVAGYYVLGEAARLGTATALDDPVLAQWVADLATNPVAPGERVDAA